VQIACLCNSSNESFIRCATVCTGCLSSSSDADDVTSNSNSLLFLSASVYALACSNSLNTLTSLFLSFSSGCECTRLCKADAAFLLASGSRSDCTIWTSSGMHPDCLIARQLSGLVLNARRVSPMSACSWPLSIASRLYTMSTLASSCWEERRDKLGLPRRAPPELDAKLITLVSSCGIRESNGGDMREMGSCTAWFVCAGAEDRFEMGSEFHIVRSTGQVPW
jgi:hypothetical protein